jgi:ubiquitin-conjugating enzyme E2 G1
MAIRRLQSELKQLTKDPSYFFSVNPNESNFLEWEFVMIGPPETFYEGGLFKGKLTFPKDYPNKAPTLIFDTCMYHPNIYNDGKVCISILHDGVDQYGEESVNERWNPSHSVNTVLLSIVSMLGYPNFNSPANIDASREWQDNIDSYRKKIYRIVSETQS